MKRRSAAAGSAWAWASAAWAARTRSACCAGGRWRWRTSPSEWFETDLLRAVVCGARASTGRFAGPWSAGTTANLLLQAAAAGGNGAGTAVQVDGRPGRADRRPGRRRARGTGRRSAPGAEVRAHHACKDGARHGRRAARAARRSRPRAVVSSADPAPARSCGLLDPAVLDPDDAAPRAATTGRQGMASKVNLALAGAARLPRRRARRRCCAAASTSAPTWTTSSARTTTPNTAASRGGRTSTSTIPTLADPSLAPAGQHVMSVYVQYTPYALREGTWDARRDEVGDAVLRTLEEYAPGLSRCVVAPPGADAARPRADVRPDRRPSARTASRRSISSSWPGRCWAGRATASPVAGLYMCGAGTHPGGGVTGGPAANAAREILKDLG